MIAIVDDVTGKADAKLGGGEANGLADFRGKIAYVENTSKMGYLVENSVHELGHNLGLEHDENGSRNFMSYDNYRTNFTQLQWAQMYHNADNKVLNQGSNSERAIKSSNNWFYNTSSNVAPYYKNVNAGDHMPKTLKNP